MKTILILEDNACEMGAWLKLFVNRDHRMRWSVQLIWSRHIIWQMEKSVDLFC